MNNRQAGRRRGRGGQRQGGNPGRPESGNRIDNRARGNAAQLLEKYKNLAADAQRSGDRINTEYYLQFADHYFRVLSESRSRFEDQQPQRRGRDDEDDGDDDYGMEGEPGSPADEDPRAMPEAMTPPAPPPQPQPQSPPPQQQAPVARPAPRVEADGDEDSGEVRAEPRRRGRPRREAAVTAAAAAGEERLDASVLPPAIPAQEPAPRRPRTRRPREADDGVVPA